MQYSSWLNVGSPEPGSGGSRELSLIATYLQADAEMYYHHWVPLSYALHSSSAAYQCWEG